jgi:hypothetical protein
VDLQTVGVLQTPFGPASNSTIVVNFQHRHRRGVAAGHGSVGRTTGYIAHIADGGGWKTAITVVNLLSVPQKITLSFYGDSGQKWSLPVLGSSAAQQKSFDLQPNASGFLETAGSATSVSTGWATSKGRSVVRSVWAPRRYSAVIRPGGRIQKPSAQWA